MTQAPAAIVPTEPNLVVQDRPCIYCSYNLKGIPVDGVCPECGKSVLDSLRGLLLQYASPEYLASVRSGLSFVLNGILLLIIVAVANVILGITFRGVPWSRLAATGLSLIPTAMLLVGYYRYTTPDPGYVGTEHPGSPRKAARVAVITQAAAQVLTLVLNLVPYAHIAPAGQQVSLAALILTVLVAVVSWCAFAVQFFAIMLYTRWLARRVPDVYLNRNCTTSLWLLPLIAVLGAIVLFLGPLIALIRYWNLLDRLRKHFKSIAATGAPANLPKRLG